MRNRLDDIMAYRAAYADVSLYECIMAVGDVSDLDNAEIAALLLTIEISRAEFTLHEVNSSPVLLVL